MLEDDASSILVLGAEEQAATSLALAYPERRFLFLSDGQVLDGWDLGNVRMRAAAPPLADAGHSAPAVPLSARWLSDPAATALSRALPRIARALPGIPLPVFPAPDPERPAIAKGDLWHRPDVPVTGNADEVAELDDPHGCGVVYQELIATQGCVMAIGRRWSEGATRMGLFRVFNERFFRINVLQAAESIDAPLLAELSRTALSELSHDGWFTLNWLLTDAGPRLSSFRPVPKAVFRCFRAGGIDLLHERSAPALLAPGLRIIAVPNYASFEWLAQ